MTWLALWLIRNCHEYNENVQDEKKMRPVDIEADVKEMERRKRVEAIMNSQVDGGGGGGDQDESTSIISLNISFLPEALPRGRGRS